MVGGLDNAGGMSHSNHNQVGVSVANAGLSTLGWYGGPTETVALLPGSDALGNGYTGMTENRPARHGARRWDER